MAETLRKKLKGNKKIHCLPGSIYEPPVHEDIPEIINGIKIVVPGSIDTRRRNYEIVFDLLEACNKLSLPVHVTLLGGFYGGHGTQILQKSKAYSMKYKNLEFYETDLVEQAEFDRLMKEAHLVFIPSVIETIIHDGVKETYGVSLCSGNMYDIARHARPFIAPVALYFDFYLENSCIRYASLEEIIYQIENLLTTPGRYALLHQHAKAASMNYTVDEVRKRNTDLFN
jgi:hypothetical protein